jgi:hypothetical protein
MEWLYRHMDKLVASLLPEREKVYGQFLEGKA